MLTTLADRTPEEFERFLEAVVERKLRDVLGLIGDEALEPEFAARLAEQRTAVAAGDRGVSLADALGADWKLFGEAQRPFILSS